MSAAMTCRETIDLLLDYLEGRLSADDRAALDAHFAACPPCLDFVASYRETPRIVRDATDVSVPAEVAERLRRFLESKRPRT